MCTKYTESTAPELEGFYSTVKKGLSMNTFITKFENIITNNYYFLTRWLIIIQNPYVHSNNSVWAFIIHSHPLVPKFNLRTRDTSSMYPGPILKFPASPIYIRLSGLWPKRSKLLIRTKKIMFSLICPCLCSGVKLTKGRSVPHSTNTHTHDRASLLGRYEGNPSSEPTHLQ